MSRLYTVVLALFLFLYILPLNSRPLIIPDETRYAEIPREMIASGDWVSPRLDGVRYFEKPVMGYWLNAVSILAFGENAFSVRLPSALAVGISALMLFLLVRRFMGRDLSALLCTGMLLSCVEVFALGTFSVLDGLLSMFLTVAMALFYFAYQEENARKKRIFLILFGLFCGLAFLTKGFLALVIPVIIIVPFMIWENRWPELWRTAWIPLVATMLIILPWALLIYQREPDFWRYFIWVEHIQRFMSANPQHPKPFWFFIPVILIGALPWSVLFPAAIQGIRKSNFKEPFFRFACCWFIFPFLFFSISRGKLPSYVLPCFPPLVIVIFIGLRQYLEAGHRKSYSISITILAVGVAMLAFMLIVTQTTDLIGIKAFKPAEIWKWIMLSAGLLIGCLFLISAKRTSNYWRVLGFFCTAPVLFLLSFHFCLPDLIKESKSPVGFLRENAYKIKPDSILVSDEKLSTAVCWTYRRDNVYVLEVAGELTYGLGFRDSRHRYLLFEQFRNHIHSDAGKGRIILIADADFYTIYKEVIPKPIYEERNGEFIWAQY